MYAVSMLALFRLRRSQPELARPYRAPLYPYLPAVALGCSFLSMASMLYNYGWLAFLFVALMLAGYIYVKRVGRRKLIGEYA